MKKIVIFYFDSLESLISRREKNPLNRSAPVIDLDNWKTRKDENANQERSQTVNDVKHGGTGTSTTYNNNNNNNNNHRSNSILKFKKQNSISNIISEDPEPQKSPDPPTVFPEPEKKVIKKEISDFVGFSSIFNQRQRKVRQRGTSLRILVMGEKSVGKSQIIRTFLSNAEQNTVKLHDHYREVSWTLLENNLNINVSTLEFPGEARGVRTCMIIYCFVFKGKLIESHTESGWLVVWF